MKRVIDKSTWDRKEHFEFFSKIDDPVFGITVEVDVTRALKKCKENNWSFHQYYHFLSTQAVNEIEEFRTRIENDSIVLFDEVHTSTTILKDNKTFAFTFVKKTTTFEEFSKLAVIEFDRARNAIGMGITEESKQLNTIHYSTLPWINFKGLKHPLSTNFVDSNPKITFGKMENVNDVLKMPVAIFGHHGLLDGYHIGLYLEKFQSLLNS
jgi:chloramphenicol O-acetyltransferase type A